MATARECGCPARSSCGWSPPPTVPGHRRDPANRHPVLGHCPVRAAIAAIGEDTWTGHALRSYCSPSTTLSTHLHTVTRMSQAQSSRPERESRHESAFETHADRRSARSAGTRGVAGEGAVLQDLHPRSDLLQVPGNGTHWQRHLTLQHSVFSEMLSLRSRQRSQ
jgi:hypothetical protein